jgi:C-terminal processing protease CtpA/Prc
MDDAVVTQVVEHVRTLVEAHYLFPDVAGAVSAILAGGLAERRYPTDLSALADAVTADLQSVNGDRHLRLVHHTEAIPPDEPNHNKDDDERAALERWAQQTSRGVACIQHLSGNIGYLELRPVLFPRNLAAESITAALTVLADTDALIVDLRNCVGGDPDTTPFIVSYLWDDQPVQLTGLREGQDEHPRQLWTLPNVAGRRYGRDKPVFVLTSGTTFSGGEHLAYDLQRLGRATLVGEATGGGAHAREGYRVHPHLEATISVAAAVHPTDGGNWERTGVLPDIPAPSADAREVAHQHAVRRTTMTNQP